MSYTRGIDKLDITYEGSAGDYNVLLRGTHIGRVRLLGDRRHWEAWSPWKADGHPASVTGDLVSPRSDTRRAAARVLQDRAREQALTRAKEIIARGSG